MVEGTERRSLLFVIPSLAIGGAERVFTTLISHLDPQTYRLRLAVVSMKDAAFAEALPAHVEVIDLHAGRVMAAMPRLLALLHRDPPDLVISTLEHLNIALAASRPLWPRRTRHVIRATNVRALNRWIYRGGLRAFYRSADGMVFQTEQMSARYHQVVRHLPVAHVAIANPIDLARVRRLAREKTDVRLCGGARQLLAVGRLDRDKGYDLLLQALAQMRSRPQLTIVGEGPHRPELEALIASLGLAQRVRLVGSRGNPYPIIASADGFVLSSRSEGFPNAVLEALALGAPVIVTPVAGLERLLADTPSATIAREISARAIAEALDEFCARPVCRTPNRLVDAFDAPASAAAYARFFEQVMDA
jgi:glycosyltransferase involved in cell wall biosynthesis